jgi:dihydroorotate dehydrogenase
MYSLLRRILFLFPPERVHYIAMNGLKIICRIPFGKRIVSRIFRIDKKKYSREAFGLHFSNTVGLGAGFDKNAEYLNELEALGFGFVEIGTVTASPQSGNEKPRLFRLPEDRALINRMGFNNEGASAVAKRLGEWKSSNSGKKSKLIVGGNIGKNKETPNEEAWKDYEICFEALYDYVDYFVVNVSSPNTPGLRALQEKGELWKILSRLQNLNRQKSKPRPILLKIAPDLNFSQIDDVIEVANEVGLDGLVTTNTTLSREGLLTKDQELVNQSGGLSGKPLFLRSTDIVLYVYEKTGGKLPLIASGGIFEPEDVRQKMEAGAILFQVWTGFIYEGPGIVKKILYRI